MSQAYSKHIILQPSFIPKLLVACAGKRTDHDDLVFRVEGILKDLPVVDSPFFCHHMAALGVSNVKEQNAIIRYCICPAHQPHPQLPVVLVVM